MNAIVKTGFSEYDAQINFKENFEGMETDNRGNWKVLFYTGNCKEVPSMDDLFQIHGNTSKGALRYALGYENKYYNNVSRDELIADFYDEFTTINDFETAADEAGIGYKKNFVLYTTKGYSQGDYAEVVVMKDDDFEGMQKFIDHVFWDSPVWGRVELELFNSIYEFEFYEMDIPDYWDYPFDMEEAKKLIEKYLRDYFKGHILLDKIVQTVLDAVPDEVETPQFC